MSLRMIEWASESEEVIFNLFIHVLYSLLFSDCTPFSSGFLPEGEGRCSFERLVCAYQTVLRCHK